MSDTPSDARILTSRTRLRPIAVYETTTVPNISPDNGPPLQQHLRPQDLPDLWPQLSLLQAVLEEWRH